MARQRRNGGHGETDRPEDVRLEQLPPIIEVAVLDGQIVGVDAGVVHQNTEIGGQLVGAGVGHVQAFDLEPALRLTEEVPCPRGTAHGGDGLEATVGQLDGNRPPDSPARAGDERTSCRVHPVALLCQVAPGSYPSVPAATPFPMAVSLSLFAG